MTRPTLVPRDTTPEAMQAQLDALRRLGPEGRLRLAFDLSESLRQTVEAGVRQRHPEYDQRTVRLAVTRLTIGEDLFKLAYPGVRVEP